MALKHNIFSTAITNLDVNDEELGDGRAATGELAAEENLARFLAAPLLFFLLPFLEDAVDFNESEDFDD